MEVLTFKAVPVAPCSICIQRLTTGIPGTRVPLPGDRELVAFYCEHREVGAYAVAAGGVVDSWTCKGMEIEQWVQFAVALPGNLAAGMQAIADDSAERRKGMN